MDINIVNAEALVVGPDEVLVIKLGDVSIADEDWPDMMGKELQALFGDRYLIIQGDDIELAKVQKSPGIAPDYADSAE
jgi:hypothetical protein